MGEHKISKTQFNHNAVLSAVKGVAEASEMGKSAEKTLRNGKLKVYDGWEDGTYTRARATYTLDDKSTVSFFLHISPNNLKIWVDNSNNPSPNHTLDGTYI